jgi:hypothetical protein
MSLMPGTPAPFFCAPSSVNPRFYMSSLGGVFLLFAFLPPGGEAHDAALRLLLENRNLFRDDRVLFFGILPDEASFAAAPKQLPFRWFADFDGELRRLYGAVDEAGALTPEWILIDPSLRILGNAPLERGPAVLRRVAALGDPELHSGGPQHAPVLISPRIFEPEFCRELIEVYRRGDPQRSGVMRVENGRTVGVLDDFKSRRDVLIEDEALRAAARERIIARLLPDIQRAFQFRATRLERYIVACYDTAEGGHFNRHRDNSTPGTAHRRFAVTINLNAEDYEGGDLCFPEFSRRTYRAPTGGAVVFSCSLLHEATPMVRGARFAFLPFLYDEEGARIREANQHTFAQSAEPEPQAEPSGPDAG